MERQVISSDAGVNVWSRMNSSHCLHRLMKTHPG